MSDDGKSEKQRKALAIAAARIEDCRKTRAKRLNLSELGLTKFPDAVRALSSLEELDIRANSITSIPTWFDELRQLREFIWYKNGPTVLPTMLASLPRLQFLAIGASNAITGLDVLGTLRSLKKLVLEDMELTAVPESLRTAKKLAVLYLTKNRITELPEWASGWTEMRELYLGMNPLSKLPDSLSTLKRLSCVYLDHCNLTTIPTVLYDVPNLEVLDLRLNPNLRIPPEILVTNNAQTILAYDRRMRKAEERRPLNEAKMILVGRGAVGKTTLVHQLVHGKFVQKHKTKGIKVSDWQVRDGEESITTHVWDFGGQEIMHGTHQFFLTERALYILVLAGREDREDEDAEYWLKMIGAFGGDAPVMVVLNKIKEHPFEVDEEMLREKYPNIIGFYETDCKKNVGIRKLRQEVEAHLRGMEDVKKVFPAAWYRIKQELPAKAANFISFDEFRKVCGELGEKDKKEQENLAHFLHVLGIALNYRDDPRLQETSVLNPHWVTGGIYALINDNKIIVRKGVLKRSDLKRVLKAADYPEDKHDFLLLLMKKFELCFPLDDDMNEWLVPELLTKKGPKFTTEFDPKTSLFFEYHYGTLLPHGLIPRFISRAYTRIVDDLRWRTGVVVTWAGAKALVRADHDKKQVEIRVSGAKNSRQQCLEWVREHFDAIHENFKKLEPKEVLRLLGSPDVAVSMAALVRAVRSNRKAMDLEVGKREVRVATLEVCDPYFRRGTDFRVKTGADSTSFRLDIGGSL